MRKEIYKLKEDETSVEAAGNRISSIRHKNITKTSGRVFQDQKIFSASFVGATNNHELLQNALKNPEGAIAFDYPLPSVQSISKKQVTSNKTAEDLIAEYQIALDELNKKFPDFIFSGKANFSSISKSLEVIDKENLDFVYDLCLWYFVYKHKKSASIMDGYFGSGDIGKLEISSRLNQYFPFLESFEEIIDIKDKKLPVVFFDPELIFSKTIESSKSDLYQKNIGLFAGKLGQQVLSEKLTLCDISFDPSLGALNLFDSEGFVRENYSLPLIENGVFKNLITDSKFAHKYSLPLTGNGHRSFDSNSMLKFNTISVLPGERSFQEILATLPKCIVVELAAGGDFTDSGEYSTPVQNGFLLENGEVLGRIPQITLTSSVERMFGEDLLEIASNPASGLNKCPAIFTQMDILVN